MESKCKAMTEHGVDQDTKFDLTRKSKALNRQIKQKKNPWSTLQTALDQPCRHNFYKKGIQCSYDFVSADGKLIPKPKRRRKPKTPSTEAATAPEWIQFPVSNNFLTETKNKQLNFFLGNKHFVQATLVVMRGKKYIPMDGSVKIKVVEVGQTEVQARQNAAKTMLKIVQHEINTINMM